MAFLLPQSFRHAVKNIPLRWVLVVPFVLQTVGAVALVGYLSYRSGQQSVEQLVDRLIAGVGDRVDQHLDAYLGKAQEVNQVNLAAIEAGTLDLHDFPALGKYFYRQARLFNFTYVNFGGKDGSFIGAGYGAKRALEIAEISPSNPDYLFYYSVDKQGNRVKLQGKEQKPQTNNTAWYIDAVRAGKPIWSSIYAWAELPDYISVSASTPVYDAQRNLIGVLGIDLELSQISRFLKSLDISQSGEIFIVEKSGLMVASSGEESPAPVVDGKAKRLAALDSQNPLIHNVTRDLLQRYGSFKAIATPQTQRLTVNQQHLFVNVIPYQDAYGLDWLVVTVVPESDFTAEMQANNARTFLLCWLTLFLATAIGALTSRWITQPVLQLSQASKALAQGKWQQPLADETPIAELKTLTHAFNQTAAHLQQAFDRNKIALEASEEKFTTVFRASPDPISISTLAEGRILEVNNSQVEFFGYSRSEMIGCTSVELNLWEDVDQWQKFRALLEQQGSVQNLEAQLRTKTGEVKTVLLSAEVQTLEGQNCVIKLVRDISDRKATEMALRQSEARFLEISESSPANIYVFVKRVDDSFYFEHMSRAIEPIHEISVEQILEDASLLLDRIHPDDRAGYEAAVKSSLENMALFQYEWRVINPSGKIKWLQGTSRPKLRENGEIAWYGVVVDITDRKMVEIALQRYERIVSATVDAISLVDREYRYQIVNQAYLHWNQKTYSEIVGYSVADLMGQEVFETIVKPKLDRCLAGETVEYNEWFEIPALGRQFLSVTYSPYTEKDQVISGIVVNVRNLTQLKLVEEALRESENRFQQIAANLPGVIYTIVHGLDGSTRLEYVSAAVEEVLEVTPAQALEDFSLLFKQWHPEDVKAYVAAVQQNLETLAPFSYEWRIITPSGKLKWLHAHRSELVRRENGELVGYGVVQDVSDRHAADRAKDEFISVVSHELRTPLTSILGSIGILETGVLNTQPATAKQMLRIALTNSERLVRLVNDILNLERLESGKVELVREECDVADLLKQAIESVQTLANEASIRLKVVPVSGCLWADAGAIVQVLTNLLGNAIKFSPEGTTVCLTVEVVLPDEKQELEQFSAPTQSTISSSYVLFAVTDQGRGIPPSKLESIFGRFQQVDVSDSRQKGGTGLGLAICKSIVKQHGGKIWAKSVLGEGSTFYFTLPLSSTVR